MCDVKCHNCTINLGIMGCAAVSLQYLPFLVINLFLPLPVDRESLNAPLVLVSVS